jgi:hypothetical protein
MFGLLPLEVRVFVRRAYVQNLLIPAPPRMRRSHKAMVR